MLDNLASRIHQQEVSMVYTEDVLDWIVEEGTDADFGARPLNRFIQRHVETVVAIELIKGDLGPNDTLALTMKDGKLIVTKK